MGVSDLVDSWVLALRAERKAPATIKSYTAGLTNYLSWCERHDLPDEINKRAVQTWVSEMLDQGAEASSARSRQLGVRRFSAWLAEEDEVPVDVLLGIKPPRVDVKVTQPLTTEQVKSMLKACNGKSLMDVRDAAMLRLMIESGVRAGEVVAMQVADLDLKAGTAVITRGKGGKGRVVPVGPQTAAAIDKYMRTRRQHKHASSPTLWLGERGRGFSYAALWKALGARAKAAGVEGFHPHLMRHSMADWWLSKGGSEQGLMSVAGWERSDMLQRYTKARASDRAADESRRLNLGDL
jgi:integrase/recombinase XerD